MNYQRIDTARTRMHRTFNSLDWTEGVRFYGAWWQSVPKQHRKHILTNRKYTCEQDYSASYDAARCRLKTRQESVLDLSCP